MSTIREAVFLLKRNEIRMRRGLSGWSACCRIVRIWIQISRNHTKPNTIAHSWTSSASKAGDGRQTQENPWKLVDQLPWQMPSVWNDSLFQTRSRPMAEVVLWLLHMYMPWLNIRSCSHVCTLMHTHAPFIIYQAVIHVSRELHVIYSNEDMLIGNYVFTFFYMWQISWN